jgi:hypothetical protein
LIYTIQREPIRNNVRKYVISTIRHVLRAEVVSALGKILCAILRQNKSKGYL